MLIDTKIVNDHKYLHIGGTICNYTELLFPVSIRHNLVPTELLQISN